MERVKWTDALIDQRVAAMDEKFELLFAETRAQREGMRADLADLRAEMRAGFTGLRGEIREVRGDLAAYQRQMMFIIAGFGIGLLGVLSAGQF
jgi:hypothetical protein